MLLETYLLKIMAKVDKSTSLNRRLLGKHSSNKIETTISLLEEGTTMTRFYSSGRRPENRTFRLKPHQFLLSWWRTPGKEDGSGRLDRPCIKMCSIKGIK